MHILLLGSGGREHAFAWKLAQSKRCTRLSIAPGNTGTALCGTNVAISATDFAAIGDFVVQNAVELVVVGPEEPLVRGIWDYFQANESLKNIPLIGPSAAGAVLEGSKAWAKQFMQRHRIPTATCRTFDKSQEEEARRYVRSHALPVVLKADGLAAGKGVVICEDCASAEKEMAAMLDGKFGEAGHRVVVEQFLKGIEFSVFVLTDGHNWHLLPEAKDYKRAGEGDTGPNTGGMGAVSPVPFANDELMEKVKSRIIQPTIDGLQAENIPYCGFIFFGLMVQDGEPFVIEYNCRMGDPETEVVLPRLKSDFVALLLHCARGSLARTRVRTDERAATTVFLVSGGYPGPYTKNQSVTGLDQLRQGIAFHAGMRLHEGRLLTDGGRVVALTALGKDHVTALKRSNRNAAIVRFQGKYYRRDIGQDVISG